MIEPVSVLHIITTLERGGAEVLLLRLLRSIDSQQFRCTVVCLGPRGAVSSDIEALGVPVNHLGAMDIRNTVGAIRSIARTVRDVRPAVVHTWMVHANLIGGLAARRPGAHTVLWSIHHTDLDPRLTPKGTLFAERANALLSRWVPAAVVCTSETARELRQRDGYPPDKLIVIHNGVPAREWTSDDRRRARAYLGVGEDQVLVGRVARFAPQKDYATFVRAAGLIWRSVPEARFVLAGRGVDAHNEDLARGLAQAGIADRTVLLGELADPVCVNGAVDVAVSSSAFGETAPLVVSEALACGTPVVGTDVGDTRTLIGPGGLVVPPRNAERLADAVLALLRRSPAERAEIGERGRRWSRTEFSQQAMTESYVRLYRSLAGR